VVAAIFLPSAPKLEGEPKGINMKDMRGVEITPMVLAHAKAGANHVSEYYWIKPGEKKPQAKMTYSIEIPDWNWVVYTGAYIDDIDSAFYSVLWRTLLLTAVVGLLVTFAMLWAIGNIHRSLGGEPDEAARLCRRIADGDLSVVFARADSKSLIGALRDMQKNLTAMFARIKQTAESITVGTSEIAAGNLDLSQRTEEQASALAESASSMEHLTETVKQNAANAHQASQLAHTASQTVSEGGRVVGDVVARCRRSRKARRRSGRSSA
jgi:methyl-accepting chemotaxis protein